MEVNKIDIQQLESESGLQQKLFVLSEIGCHPSIYRRGGLWRAHVNACGNYWAESAVSPLHALNRAISDWREAGCPMDGLAIN